MAGDAGGEDGSAHFSKDSGEEDDACPHPRGLAVEQIEAGAHSSEGEEHGEEQDGDEHVEAAAQLDLPLLDAREANTGEEANLA
jgi:hypothetical protein